MPEKLTLLLIEDNPAERALLEARLADCPDVVWQSAESLGAAQAVLDRGGVEVALLDLELPDARGIESVARLQQRNPGLAIVVLSGFGGDDPELAGEALSAGAQDYLAKRHVEAADLYRTFLFARLRKTREQAEIKASLRDPLTGLPRLPLLEERFRRSLARGRRQALETALLHIDIDGLAAFRQSEGDDRAEALIRDVAGRLARQIRRTDGLARLAGGSFLALVDGMKHSSDAYVVARKLLDTVRRPQPGAAEPAPVGLSIGVARGPAGDSDFAVLQARAEAAMYQARRRGRNHYATAAELELAAE